MLLDRIREVHQSRDTGLLITYLGLETGRPCSLRAAGLSAGLTAERVRQIIENIRQSIVFMEAPEIHQLSHLLDEHAPCTSGHLHFLIEKGGACSLRSSVIHPSGWIRLAEFAGMPFNFVSTQIKGFPDSIFMSHDDRLLFDRYYADFHSLSERVGACTANGLVDLMVKRKRDSDIESASAFFGALKQVGCPVVTDRSGQEWLCLPCSSGFPVMRIARLLSATGTLPLSARIEDKIIYAGFSPDQRMPREVLGFLLARENIVVADNVVKWQQIELMTCRNIVENRTADSNTIKGDPPLSIMRMIDIIKGFNGRMSKKDFFEACVQSGIKLATARVYGYNSGLFRIEGDYITLS